MTLRGRQKFTGKIVIDIKIIEQVNSFNSFGNLISYEKEMDIDNKLNNYLKIKDISNNMFRPQKTSKNTTAKPQNREAIPDLLYGSENWTIKARDARRLTAAEMKYIKKQQDTLGRITKQTHILLKN